MTETKTPETPETIIELIDVIDWRFVTLALLLGIAAGAVFVYLFVEIPSEDRRNA